MRKTINLSARALIQRINRRLADQGEVLKQARGARAKSDVGDYFVVDINHNAIVRSNVDIAALGRKLGALQPFETLQP